MYLSNGGGNIGAGATPAIAAVGAAFLDALERDIDLLQSSEGIPPVPAAMTVRVTAVTFGGLWSVVIDLAAESPDGHQLARLNDAGQDLVTQFRLNSPDS